jgi:hypothetical protein
VRLLRMQRLVDELERVCAEGHDQRDALSRLLLDMEAAWRA